MLKKSLSIIFLLALLNLPVSAHKFYTSLTQVEYNPQTRSAEVIMNLFTDDLEKALTNHYKKPIRSTDKDFALRIYRYLDSKFIVKDSKKSLFQNEYVGLEFKRDLVSVYFEIKLDADLKDLYLTQSSLLETNKEQTNIVNLKSGKSRSSLVFRAGEPDSQAVGLSQ